MATVRKTTRRNRNPACIEVNSPDLKSLVAERAYMFFERRGRRHGRDLDDWLEAERQVLVELKKNRKSRIL